MMRFYPKVQARASLLFGRDQASTFLYGQTTLSRTLRPFRSRKRHHNQKSQNSCQSTARKTRPKKQATSKPRIRTPKSPVKPTDSQPRYHSVFKKRQSVAMYGTALLTGACTKFTRLPIPAHSRWFKHIRKVINSMRTRGYNWFVGCRRLGCR